jgi:hypothetical protein
VIPIQVSISPSMLLDAVIANWLLTIGLMAVGLVAFWTFQERQNRGSTVENVGNRADDFFGNVLGGFGSLVFVALTILTTIGANLVDLTEVVVGVVSSGPPLLLVNIAGALLGALGISGVIDISITAWLIGALTVTVIGLAVRRGRMRGSSP